MATVCYLTKPNDMSDWQHALNADAGETLRELG